MQDTLTVPTTDGSGDAVEYRGGFATLQIAGTFDDGTVTLEASYDGGTTWLTYPGIHDDLRTTEGVYSADGGEVVWLGGHPLVRLTLADSSGSTDVAATLHYGLCHTRAE